MATAPYLFPMALGLIIGHLFSFLNESPKLIRLFDYAIGVLSAIFGALLCFNVPELQNKLMAVSALAAFVALLVFHLLLRLPLVRDVQKSVSASS